MKSPDRAPVRLYRSWPLRRKASGAYTLGFSRGGAPGRWLPPGPRVEPSILARIALEQKKRGREASWFRHGWVAQAATATRSKATMLLAFIPEPSSPSKALWPREVEPTGIEPVSELDCRPRGRCFLWGSNPPEADYESAAFAR